MKENTDEKSLVKLNENSIFYKIKQFFQNLFHKNKSTDIIITTETINSIEQGKDKRNTFIKEIRQVEDEETIVKKLQNKYRNGEIKEEDMTEEQINSLCALYDKQIANLKKSNDLRKQKLLEYRRKLQTE